MFTHIIATRFHIKSDARSVRVWGPVTAFRNREMLHARSTNCEKVVTELLHYSNQNRNNACTCTSWQWIFFRLMLFFWLMFCSCFQALFIMHEPHSGPVIISNVLDLQHQAQRLKGRKQAAHSASIIWATVCLSRGLASVRSNQTKMDSNFSDFHFSSVPGRTHICFAPSQLHRQRGVYRNFKHCFSPV